jgi:hypothetical protein
MNTLTEPHAGAMTVLTRTGQHDAPRKEIHAYSPGCDRGIAIRRLARDVGRRLGQVVVVLPRDGCEASRQR